MSALPRRLLLLAMACASACVPAGKRNAVTTPHTVTTQWMLQDCRVGETGDLVAALQASGDPAETELLHSYDHGAPSSLRDQAATEAGRQYDEIIGALNAGRTSGLSSAEVDAIRADSRPVFVRAALDDFDEGYRHAALNGLAVIGRPRGVALLRRVATDPFSSDRETALAALVANGIPVTPP